MKKLTILLITFTLACSSEDEPVFTVEDTFLVSRFDKFVEIAENHQKVVPKNMVLRFVEDADKNINDSKSYTKDGQTYIDIDKGFKDQLTAEDHVEMIVFQNLAHGLFGTPFRECGIMRQIKTTGELPLYPSWDYGDYPVLFDASAPCND